MICRICEDARVTEHRKSTTLDACDACLSAIGDIRIWFRESKREDTLERAVELRKLEINSGKALAR